MCLLFRHACVLPQAWLVPDTMCTLPQAGLVPDTMCTRCACACSSDMHVCYRKLSLCLIQHAQGVLVLAFPTRMCATTGLACACYNVHKVCLCLLFRHACVLPHAGLVPDTMCTRCACACFSDTHVCYRMLGLCLIQCAQGVLVLAFPTRMCATECWACA